VAFASAWANAVSGTSYLPMTRAELETLLLGCTERLGAALRSEPFRPKTGYEIGTELVAAHIASAEALGRTIEVIQLRLCRDLGLSTEDLGDRMARLLRTVATGYARALRDRTLDEQESIRRAALVARGEFERALRDSEARFRDQATHDGLTGLPNRLLVTERLEEILAEAATPGYAGRRLGLCSVDLDRFKVVNERHGHVVGDGLLRAVGERLAQRLGQHLVARTGADEFLVLIESTTATVDATRVAEAALAAIAESPFRVDGHELRVTASIGVVEQDAAGADPAELFRAADITLHWAKSEGRNRWALFDAERNARELDRYALAAAMPEAVERGEFFLQYQPLVSLSGDRLIGVEALVRWQHPTFGVLSPDRFISLAEETGVIVTLGAAVLAQASADAQRWTTPGGQPPFVSVNLAVRQVRDSSLVRDVTAILERTGLPPSRLQLEITESAVMGRDDESVAALQQLADLGIRIAIDDFGTGYSNLSYLRALPVHALKVDGSFVAGLRQPGESTSTTDERILGALVSLAHTLGLSVTVEGVETAGQAQTLREIGCDSAQGWHFGRPIAAEHMAALLAAA
jgi:diguanylate cyclase (GGDEF)-like protein